MNYPINTPGQARAVIKSLRAAKGLSQTQVGMLMGVSQKRIARIETAPERTSLAQVAKLVALLGGHLVIEDGATAGRKTNATW